MTIKAKSVILKQNEKYLVFSNVYKAEGSDEPSHLDVVNSVMNKGYSGEDFFALSTATWKPFSIEIYPELDKKIKDKIIQEIKKDIATTVSIMENKELLKDMHKKDR